MSNRDSLWWGVSLGIVLAMVLGCNIVDEGVQPPNSDPDAGYHSPDVSDPDAEANDPPNAQEPDADPDSGPDPIPDCPEGQRFDESEGRCVVDLLFPIDPPSCDDPDPPTACSETPPTYLSSFDRASRVVEVALAPDTCCVDFDGDGQINNALSSQVFFGGELDFDVLQLGLTFSGEPGQFPVETHVWRVRENQLGDLRISSDSFDDGAHPRSLFRETYLEQVFYAFYGRVYLPASILGLSHGEIALRNAILLAEDVANPYEIDELFLTGTVAAEDLVAALDEFDEACPCYGLESSYSVEGGWTCSIGSDDTATCDDATCSDPSTICSYAPFVNGLFDLDTTGDGHTNAFSLALQMRTEEL